MTTLFDPAVNAEICNRIGKLEASSKARWGKMNVEQMLAHAYLSLQVSFGNIELKPGILGTFFRGISRRILLAKKPYPKHLPADKKVLTKEPGGFSEERQRLENAVRSYLEKGPEGLSKKPHNIIGKITPEQSAFISFKHLDHHLRQFGV